MVRQFAESRLEVIDFSPAAAMSYIDAVSELKGESIVVAGFYEDTLRRVEGRWKFTEKVIRLDFLVPLQEGWGGKKFKRSLMPPE